VRRANDRRSLLLADRNPPPPATAARLVMTAFWVAVPVAAVASVLNGSFGS